MKSVLITGASSGMGLETAKLLAEKGYQVFAGVRDKAAEQRINRLASQCQPGTHFAYTPVPVYLDVTRSESIGAAVDKVLLSAEKLDVLINNAGYGLISSVEDADDDMEFRQFDVNVFGVLRCCRAVIPTMRKQGGGQIINISSFLGKVGLPFLTHYNASKYAVEGITDSLRYELADFGIRVNTVAPGLFKTGFVNKGADLNSITLEDGSPYAKFAQSFIPMVAEKINHGAHPGEVADAVLHCIESRQATRRVTAGEDAAALAHTAASLGEEKFDKWYTQQMGLPEPA